MAGRASLKKLLSIDRHRLSVFPATLSSSLSSLSQTDTGKCSVSSSYGSRSTSDKNAANCIRILSGVLSFASLSLLLKGSDDGNVQCEAISEINKQLVESERTTLEGSPSNSKSTYFLSDAYRRRVFFKYERRIRMRSPPEKVFDYFASVKTSEGEAFMSPADLMRAVVPVFPPSESSLVRDGYLPGERPPGELRCPPSNFFMLFDTNGDGFISFSEYIFFVTLLSIPESSFNAAFKMFDLDGNGTIDREEFKKVMGVMRGRTRQGIAQRDGLRIGLKVENTVENGGLVELFFGKDGKKLLLHEDFQLFLRELQEEIIRLEFSHYDYSHQGTISAKDFGLSLVATADLSLIDLHLDRVDALGSDASLENCRISFEEFHNFAKLRRKLPSLAFAISSYGETNGMLSKADFQRAASQVCNIPVTDKVVDVVFYIFDVNNDGNLSIEEFLGVLERRELDIVEPKESGIMYYLKCWWSCARDCKYHSKWRNV